MDGQLEAESEAVGEGLEEVALQGPLGPQRMYNRLEVIPVKRSLCARVGSVRVRHQG